MLGADTNVSVVPITHGEAYDFVLKHHYSGRFPSGAMFIYGKYDDGSLVGVCVFGSPASPWVSVSATGERNRVLELQRLALSNNASNEASWFVAKCFKNLAKHWSGIVVSYADTGAGHHGGVYQALGFKYGGISRERTDIASDGHARHHGGDPSVRQRRTAKHRYWIQVPRNGKAHCLWESQKYPKPDIS
jgi:hypothetical protein